RSVYDRYSVPGPARPIFQVAFGNWVPGAQNAVNYGKFYRPPLLLIAGAEDRLVPPVSIKLNSEGYARSTAMTEYKEFPHRSHLLIAQEGWEEVADYALSWALARIEDVLPWLDPSEEELAIDSRYAQTG